MYTVKILSSEDFDKLPYKRARTSLGLANAKTGRAFVRDTGYNDITKATIGHELDELVANVSPHEEDGIRYKNLASFGAGAGAGALSNMIPGLKKFSPVISAGAGALANKDKNYMQGAMQGFSGGGIGQSVGSGLGSSIKGLTEAGGTFGKAAKGFMPGVSTGASNYMQAIPGMKGFGTDQPVGKVAQWLAGSGGQGPKIASGGGQPINMDRFSARNPLSGSSLPENAMDIAREGGGFGSAVAPSSTLQAPGGASPTGGKSIMEQFKQYLPGLLTTQVGNLFAPKVDVPNIAGVGQDLARQLKAGELGEPFARELGMNELQRGLESEIGTPPVNAFDLGDADNEEAKMKALQNYTNHWKSIRPGADFSNDPEFARGYNEIQERYDRMRAAQRDETTFQYTQQQLQQKYQYMVQALGMDERQMSQYVQLAQLEVDQLMLEYGLSVEEATQFKQLFGDLGQIMMQGGQK